MDTATAKMSQNRANRAESFELFKLRLEEQPDEIVEAAEFLGRTPTTIKLWLEGKRNADEIETIILQESFLRKKGILGELVLDENPSYNDAIYFGISECLFDLNDVAAAVGVNMPTIRRYFNGSSNPRGWQRAKLDWFLANVTVHRNGRPDRPLRPMDSMAKLQPELVDLYLACCRGDLSPEAIANQLGVPIDRINSWLIYRDCGPTAAMMLRIHEQFAPYLTDGTSGDVSCAKTPVQNNETAPKQAVTKSSPPASPRFDKPLRASVAAEETVSPPIPTATTGTQTVESLMLAHAEILRCLINGYGKSRKPSQAIASLEAIRVKDPDLWYELLLAVGIIADPTGRFPAWIRTKR